MIEYIEGRIVDISKNKIILENSRIGYSITTTTFFALNEEIRIYIYHYKTELKEELYGFRDKLTKDLFIELLSIKGVGCKLALSITNNNTNEVRIALENGDYEYFMTIPKIGEKLAKLIVKDIKISKSNDELISALQTLGYDKKQIYEVITKIDTKNSLQMQIKEALKLLLER